MPTLAYYAVRGLAQPIRFLLAYLGIEFTDKHYTERDDWFKKDKQELGLDFANLPYYIDENIRITESIAIAVYLIKHNNRNDLLGQSADGSYSEREVRVQQVLGVIRDLQKEFFPLFMNPQFETVKETHFTEKISPILTKLTNYLGDKEFLVGTLSYADFIFYETASLLKHIFPAILTPQITSYSQRFENLPGIKEYFANPSLDLKIYVPPGVTFWKGVP